MFKPYPAPCLACVFLECTRASKSPQRRVTGLFPIHACGDVLGYLLFQMKLNLVIQSLSETRATEQSLPSEPQSSSPNHDISLLRCLHYQVDCRRQATPISGFL